LSLLQNLKYWIYKQYLGFESGIDMAGIQRIALGSGRAKAAADVDAVPGVWRGDQLDRAQQPGVSTGHAALDAQLPGQGWPLGQLIEVLQVQPGLHEWRLLLPALREAATRGPLVLVGAPQLPHLSALAAQGIDAGNVLRVEARQPLERLWAAEQVLRCRELGALLAWLPQVRPEQLRRLQLAGASHAALMFAFRPDAARHESSPAPLRLRVRGEAQGLQLEIIKRRGPALDQPITVPATLPVMVALRKRRVVQDLDRNAAHAVDRFAPPRPERRALTLLVASPHA
jgi:protein ImuA